MKNSIIGTAGHVDHGKTMLIKALTGIDTDRLREEKKRGITIELGFAHLELPDGGRAGIIDVPGHERFIRNMLAGVGGVDLVLLVVAADEGFMPQTQEHLDILSLLEAQNGLIVLTKADLVEPEWLGMVTEEVLERVRGTFLEGAPVFPVSSFTGEGLPELKAAIFESLGRVRGKNTLAPFRIPMDRVFTMEGFGTVITGTLTEGVLKEGTEAMLYPSRTPVRVRGLQVHGRSVDTAYAGQRAAVNLAGVKKEEVRRGDFLAAPGSMESSYMLDVSLQVLPGCNRVLENGSRLHFHHGAGEALCKLVLLDADMLSAGESGFAQLRFSDPVSARPGDRFILRFYSPVETVAGGVILNAAPVKHRRRDTRVLEGLRVLQTGSPKSRVEQAVLDLNPLFAPVSAACERLSMPLEEFEGYLKDSLADGTLIAVTPRLILHREYLERFSGRLQAALQEYHKAFPLLPGMPREEVRGKLLPSLDTASAEMLFGVLEGMGKIRQADGRLSDPSFCVQYSPVQQRVAQEIEQAYKAGGYAPPAPEELAAQFPKEKREYAQVMEALAQAGTVVLLSPQIVMHREFCEAAFSLFSQKAAQGPVALGDFRDALGTSRKYAVALLEYFDRKGLTKKTGDMRVLAKG